MSCNSGCQIPRTAKAAATAPKQCESTNPNLVPCKAPSYSTPCLPGDPNMSPLQIARAARSEHLFTRELTFAVNALQVGDHTTLQAVFPAFTASGNACIKSVTLIVDGVAVPVNIVGVSAVWLFASPASNVWTSRVAIPCEKLVNDIITTTGRCPCDVECEGCIYPAGVGGLFAVAITFPSTAFALGDVVTFSVTGTHTQQEPCCVIPELLAEPQVVAGPYPAIQSLI